MAKWVAQNVVSSITPAARRRTNDLAPLAADARRVIQRYLEESPTAEDVTLEVLQALERPLRALREAHGAAQVNQRVGLWVAQTLVDLYGAANVQTLRGDDGRSVSTRRNTRTGLIGVERYTPHRVRAPDRESADRILLDTIVVNHLLREHKDAIDIRALKERAGAHRISLADGALAELARGLTTRRLPIDLWARRSHLLADVLDPDLPVGPGGQDLFAIIGVRRQRGFDFDAMQSYYRGVWGYLRSCRTARDLDRPGYYTDAAGRRYEVKLDAAHIEATFADVAQGWARWVAEAGAEFAKLAGGGDKLDEEELRHLVRLSLDADLSSPALDKIDLAVRVIAARTREAGLKSAYRPTEPNDAIDFDLLLATALPAVVCTHDQRLLRLAERSGSSEAWRVMTPPVLLDWLARSEEGATSESELSAEEQRAAWNTWVNHGPQGPIEDEVVGWP